MRYAYKYHRQNARRRGHEWGLTQEEWREFWEAHPEAWAEKKKWILSPRTTAKMKRSTIGYEIDRIDPNRGYFADNIRITSKQFNISREWDEGRRRNIWTVTEDSESRGFRTVSVDGQDIGDPGEPLPF